MSCCLYAKTGIFCRVHPTSHFHLKRQELFFAHDFFSSLSLSPPALATSAIFLPSKAANPFSSFHWCLKLPWPRSPFFFPFPKRGHGRAVFFAAHHPSMPCGEWDQESIILLFGRLACQCKTSTPLHSTRCLPSGTKGKSARQTRR